MCAVMTSTCRIVCAHMDLDEPHCISGAGSSPTQGRENAARPAQLLTGFGTGTLGQTHSVSVCLKCSRPRQNSAWVKTDLSHHFFSGKTTGNRLTAALWSLD